MVYHINFSKESDGHFIALYSCDAKEAIRRPHPTPIDFVIEPHTLQPSLHTVESMEMFEDIGEVVSGQKGRMSESSILRLADLVCEDLAGIPVYPGDLQTHYVAGVASTDEQYFINKSIERVLKMNEVGFFLDHLLNSGYRPRTGFQAAIQADRFDI